MKNIFILMLWAASLLVSTRSIAQGSVAALDAKNGFKGYTFGTSINNCKGLAYDGSMISHYDESFDKKLDGYLNLYDFKTYGTNDKNLSIGDLKISSPTYYSFNNRLIRIDFFAGAYEGKELIRLYKSLYGAPKITNSKTWLDSNIVIYTWRGSKVNLNVTYCPNPYQGSTVVSGSKPVSPWVRVVYSSLPMLAEMKNVNAKASRNLNKSRAGDL